MRTWMFGFLFLACSPKAVPPVVSPVESPPVAEEVPAEPTGPVSAEDAWGEVEVAPAEPTEEELRAQADESLQKAVGRLSTGSADEARLAVDLLRAITRDYPDDALAYYNLGLAYQLMGQMTDARKAYLRATDIYPGLGQAWLNLGAIPLSQGNHQKAVQYYRAGLRDGNDPENMALRSALINALREMGKVDAAVEEAKKALRVNANSLEIYNDLALVYLDSAADGGDSVAKRLSMATFYLGLAREKQGGEEHPRVQYNLGRVNHLKGNMYLAKAYYKKALEADPDMIQCALALSAIYLDDRNYGDAVPVLEKAVALEPENPSIRLNLGIAYRGVERYAEAQREYEKVLELAPEDPEPYLNLAILTGDYMKQFDDAIAHYETYGERGGERADLIDGYIAATKKEKKRIAREEKKNKAREAREREKAERQQKLEEAKREQERLKRLKEAETPAEPVVTPGGTDGAESDPPAQDAEKPEPPPEPATPEPATPEPGEDSPWD